MGLYINPQDCKKEQWLQDNGIIMMEPAVSKALEAMFVEPSPYASVEEKPLNSFLVCLVNNGYFNAAAVAFDKREAEEFTRPDDTRKKQWFLVPISKIKEVCPDADHYIE